MAMNLSAGLQVLVEELGLHVGEIEGLLEYARLTQQKFGSLAKLLLHLRARHF